MDKGGAEKNGQVELLNEDLKKLEVKTNTV